MEESFFYAEKYYQKVTLESVAEYFISILFKLNLL